MLTIIAGDIGREHDIVHFEPLPELEPYPELEPVEIPSEPVEVPA